MITTSRLKELFDYSPKGGLIREKTSTNSLAGRSIGWRTTGGYLRAMVDGESYYLHHLVWIWHGNDPVDELDHINRINTDNRIENIRIATRSQNMWNIRIAKNNTSGVKGVIWKKDKQKWRVRIGVNGKRIHIGDFDDLELAELVVMEARAKYHGAFANAH